MSAGHIKLLGCAPTTHHVGSGGMCAGPTTDCLGKDEAESRAADARHGLDARRREWGEERGRSGKIECLPCRQRGRKGRWVAGLLLIRATHLQGNTTAAPAEEGPHVHTTMLSGTNVER